MLFPRTPSTPLRSVLGCHATRLRRSEFRTSLLCRRALGLGLTQTLKGTVIFRACGPRLTAKPENWLPRTQVNVRRKDANPRASGITSSATLRLDEGQRGRVHAIAQAGRTRAVVEDVAEMGVALGASHLVARHPQAGVAVSLDVLLGDGLPEARPAGAGVELGRRREQRILAAHAAEYALSHAGPSTGR